MVCGQLRGAGLSGQAFQHLLDSPSFGFLFDPVEPCRHNLAYWRSENWWGVGPGAHSHVGGTRWWNVRHPAAYAARLAAGESPAAAREILTAGERSMERVMLGVRLADGLPLADLNGQVMPRAQRALAAGHLDPVSWRSGSLVLTREGRLLADGIVRDLT